MKWGIIGTGNMGTILAESWLESGMLKQEELYITNRTIDKAHAIQRHYPNIHVCEDAASIAEQTDVVFICVKPLDIHPLLVNLESYLSKQQCLVSITSPYAVEELEELVPCQVARLVPSITNRALSGVSLLTFGDSVEPVMKGYLTQSCKVFSRPLEIKDSITRVSSDIVSCGPAFFSYLVQRFIQSACEETDITEEEASIMMTEMIIGYGKLIEEGHYSLKTLQEKVCVKGGVTGEGIDVLEREVGNMFNLLFHRTHHKYAKDKKEIRLQKLR